MSNIRLLADGKGTEMAKVFAEGGFKASGSLIPFNEFKLFRDRSELKPNPRKAEAMIKKGEEALEKEIPLLPASLYREFSVNGNRSRFQDKYFLRRSMLLDLNMAEYCEGKGRFSEKLMDVVWAIMEESTWILPAHLHNAAYDANRSLPSAYTPNRLHGLALFAASTGSSLASVLLFNRGALDAIEPAVCEKLEYVIKNRIINPFLQGTYWWLGETGSRINNWGPWIISNVLFTTAVLEPDPYVREKVLEKAMAALDRYTDGLPADGGCDEGPSYWSEAGGAYFDCLEIIYDMTGGKINAFSHPFVKLMGEYIAKVNINDKRFVNFADCGPYSAPDGVLLRSFGERCGSELLCAFGDSMARLGDIHVVGSCMYRALRNLYAGDVTAEKCKGALRNYLPNLKVATSRQSEDTSRGMFIAAKGGHNKESHNHNDVGNFIVYYNGNPVIIDTGAGQYTKQTFSAQRYEIWTMQSHYHNLPAFDGVGQHQGKQYCSTDEIYNEQTGEYSVELKEAYLAEAGIISYRRSSVLRDGVVCVNDAIALDREREIDFRFMTHVKPTLKEPGKLLLAEDRVMSFSPELKCEIEAIEAPDSKLGKSWNTDYFYRIHLTLKAQNCNQSFTFE